MIRHTLFIGLNDKDSKQQEINTLDAFKIVMNLTRKYYEGGTISEAKGFYTHKDGTLTIETSLILSILFAETEKTLQLVNEIKQALNQESIALQSEDINSNLI